MSACERKSRYETEGLATRAAAAARARTRDIIQHYYCKSCSGWHIGHVSLRRLRRVS